jgi:hypothetical protein
MLPRIRGYGAARGQQMQKAVAAFAVPVTRRLRAHGLRGREAQVTLAGDALQIAGADSGVLVLPPARVQRLRVGWEETKHGVIHEARLWLVGEAKPLVLQLKRRAPDTYAEVIASFARALPPDRLEHGTTKAAALFLPIAFGLLSAVALGISLFVLTEEPWWGRLLVPVVPVGVFLYGLYALRRMWPGPVADQADFVRHITRQRR